MRAKCVIVCVNPFMCVGNYHRCPQLAENSGMPCQVAQESNWGVFLKIGNYPKNPPPKPHSPPFLCNVQMYCAKTPNLLVSVVQVLPLKEGVHITEEVSAALP